MPHNHTALEHLELCVLANYMLIQLSDTILLILSRTRKTCLSTNISKEARISHCFKFFVFGLDLKLRDREETNQMNEQPKSKECPILYVWKTGSSQNLQ